MKRQWSGIVKAHAYHVTIGGHDPIDEMDEDGDGFVNLTKTFVVLSRGNQQISRYDELHASQMTWISETTPDISERLYLGDHQEPSLDLLETLRFCDGLEVTLSISGDELPEMQVAQP